MTPEQSTPPLDTRMPAEWAPHRRTWMAFPPSNQTFGPADGHDLQRARTAWSRVAAAISAHEPVTVVADPADREAARTFLDEDIEVATAPLDDAWMRDMGPSFVHSAGGSVRAVDWIFNGWGAQSWARWDRDGLIGRTVAGLAGAEAVASSLVNEGGGFHVDGEGTVLLTETVQLDEGRNPGLTKEQVEQELHARLGTTHAVWLPRGLTRDYEEFGTRGHVDIVAAFAGPGRVLLHMQGDPEHPDHAVSLLLREHLRGCTDAQGRPLEVIEVLAPTVLRDEEGFVDYSYINHYVCNGAVILCAFDDPHDEVAADVLRRAYPGREIVLVDARDIFAFGGGIHCITQQEPAPVTVPGGAAEVSA